MYIATTLANLYKKNKDLDKSLLTLFRSNSSLPTFYKFLLLQQLFSEHQFLEVTKKYLSTEILLASNNVTSKSITTLLDLTMIPNILFYQIDISSLKTDDQSMIYDGFVEMQTYVVEEILSIPRISKFFLQHNKFFDVK